MELSQIRYFIAAAQFQNLSQAARVLNITQPALTKSILKLEEELGVYLFDRAGKKVVLNEQGKRFLNLTLNSVRGLDDAASAVKSHLISNPSLYIGLFQHSEEIMRCLEEFSNVSPEICIQLDHLRVTSNDVDTNRFDMLLYPKNSLFQKYKGEIVYFDPYLLAVRVSDPLTRAKAVRLSALSARRVVFIKHEDSLFDLPYNLCVSLGVRIRESLFTNSHEIQRWLISNGRGVGFVPRSGAAAYSSDPNITLLPVAEERLGHDIMVGFKREKHLSAAGRALSSFVREYFSLS